MTTHCICWDISALWNAGNVGDQATLSAEVRLVPLWLGGHERAMRERLPGKPLVLEEFGKVGSAVPIPDKFYYNVRLASVSPCTLLCLHTAALRCWIARELRHCVPSHVNTNAPLDCTYSETLALKSFGMNCCRCWWTARLAAA